MMKKREIVKIKNEATAFENIITNIALEMGLERKIIDDVIKHSLAFLKEHLQSGENDKILFNGLGTFSLLEKKIKHFISKGHLDETDEITKHIKTE